MQAVPEHGFVKHVNDSSTWLRLSHVKRVVLGFPKHPHLPPLETDSPRNNVNATMVDAEHQQRKNKITPQSTKKKVRKLNSCFIKNPLKVLCVFFCQDSESGLGIEIGHRQPKCQRKPKFSSMANPVVCRITLVYNYTHMYVFRIRTATTPLNFAPKWGPAL